MSLLPTETYDRGFVRDTTTGVVIVTTDASNATWQNGFLRDPDGRLVVVSA
jgi:hypothetical protein